MAEHRKRPRDPNQLGKLMVDIATGAVDDGPKPISPASEFAREGGLKGGKARAEKLSGKRRSEIAAKAAKSRWAKKRPTPAG